MRATKDVERYPLDSATFGVPGLVGTRTDYSNNFFVQLIISLRHNKTKEYLQFLDGKFPGHSKFRVLVTSLA